MEFEMPEMDDILALPEILIDDVREGDLLFFSRKGSLQNMFWAVGDIWLHTALAIERLDGVMCTGEVGAGPEIFSRSIEQAVMGCDLAAIGRLDLPAGCLASTTNWVKSQIGGPQEYAWDDFLLAALAALTRKGLPSSMLAELGSVMQQVADDHTGDVGDRSRTCASFVHEAFERLDTACGIPIEMTDTSRFGIFESTMSDTTMSYANMVGLPTEQQQDQVLANTTLYELFVADEQQQATLEGIGDSRVTRHHISAAVSVAFELVKKYISRPPGTQAGELPGSWASPTDLWRSERIALKARIARP